MPERPHSGDMAQIRLMGEQIADMAIAKYTSSHQETVKAEIPPSLKMAGAVVSAVLTAAVIGFCIWMVTTLNEMQITVARIDERQQSERPATSNKFIEIERRITNLESFHRAEGARDEDRQ